MAVQADSSNSPAATVLVVDDTPENLSVLGDLLQPYYRVLAANSGKRALELAASDPRPDLILLDVMMPVIDGYAVLKSLKGQPKTSDIPVVFVTAMDAPEDEQYGLDLGALDYITKPLRPPIVLARVRTQLELKRARDWLRDQNVFLEAEVARRAAENEMILAAAGEGIFGMDATGVINFINPAACTMLGYGKTELLGEEAHRCLYHARADDTPYSIEDCCIHSAVGQALWQKEDVFWRKDGKPLPVEFSSMPILRDGRLLGTVVTFMDISERKRYLDQLERRSNFDELTGLPNRNLLRDRLSHAILRCMREECALAVLVINLDRFKEINDTLGHDTGDRVLCAAAQRLKDLAQDVDTLARLDGDEFVILAEGGGDTLLAQAILSGFTAPFFFDAREFYLSISIGIAVYPKDGGDADNLLRNAGAAVYKSKAVGGDAFRYYAAEMNARSLDRLEMENDLRHAVERGELELFYQPQLNLRSGEIIGCEALIRWRHPQRGLVLPAEFIPLTEETGLIVPIGEWVLRTACLQNKAWHDAGLATLTVAVNLSARQFAAQDVVALAGKVLQESGLDPNFLELELTESAVMADADAFIHATQSLKGLQVTLSIDDFGTGFSSLSYLKRFAIDRLKIDKSFVRDINRDPNDAAIAQAIISLSHNLKLSVIAEGVETEAQLSFLRMRGCDEMQGFYFSKPIPAAEFEQLLRERRKLVFPPGTELPERTLLLVDDEPGILSSLKRLLRREGYQILTAGSGMEGLDMLAGHRVNVVVSDSLMPQMKGAEFLGRVREMYPNTVRIMLSGYTDLQAVTDAVNKGELFKFITKPWNDSELLETIRKAFHQGEARHWRAQHGGSFPDGADEWRGR